MLKGLATASATELEVRSNFSTMFLMASSPCFPSPASLSSSLMSDATAVFPPPIPAPVPTPVFPEFFAISPGRSGVGPCCCSVAPASPSAGAGWGG